MTTTAAVVHVVDDDEAVRDSLRFLLEAADFAVRTHASAEALLSAAPRCPGCVLTDVRMPGVDGLELLRRLHRAGVDLPVIVMTGHADVPMAVRAMKAGALDFLEKPFSADALVASVRTALDESRRAAEARAQIERASARIAGLTPREREVFELLVTGLSTKAIANALGASPRTIEVHRARVMEKLDAGSLPEVVRLALAAQAHPSSAGEQQSASASSRPSRA